MAATIIKKKLYFMQKIYFILRLSDGIPFSHLSLKLSYYFIKILENQLVFTIQNYVRKLLYRRNKVAFSYINIRRIAQPPKIST